MIDKQVLKKFIVGLGSDHEVDLCESYLNDCDVSGSDSVLDLQLDQETKGDSLIQSLRNSGDSISSFEDVTDEIQACIQDKLEASDIVKFLRPPESNDEIGRIGPYRLLKKIGSGGMGIVFRAENIESGSAVALKVMNPMIASNPLAAERFQREVRSAAKLDHARIIKIQDVGRDAGIPFFAMELLQGRPLSQHLEQNGRLPANEVKQLVTQVAEGLDYASQQGILHRDIKPDNLWLTDEGNVIILDFGLARGKDDTAGLTNTGDVLGTPRYMAPEQVKGQVTDQRTDLFSLGSVMYEMLTGSSKFADDNVFASMMAVTQRSAAPEELTALGCPTPLANLTCRLLTKDPEGRPASAALVVQELEQMDISPAIHTENRGGRAKSNWPKYVALFAIPLLIALSIFIYVQTDRGTLVLEAEDGVEITSEKNGRVKIRLVDSDKIYNISVGTRQLPSGSYEIVVDDESDGYSFSSPQFVIRRGQQQLVKISLRKDGDETREAFTQKYAPVEKWFESNHELFDESIFALGKIAETDGRDFVFRLEANIDKANDEFEIAASLFHYSLDQLFGSPLQILRAGKIIGQAKLLDDLPLVEGEKQYQTSFIGRLGQSDSENITLQNEDVVVVRRDLGSTQQRKGAVDRMQIDFVPNPGSNPWPRAGAIREFLNDKFPGCKKFYVGSISNVSLPLARFKIDSYFDLTIKRTRSGEERISRDAPAPSLNGKYAYVFAGSELIGQGKVAGLLGEKRDNFIELQDPLAYEPQLGSGNAIVIPATESGDPIEFKSEPEANLTALTALPILETLGLKHGEPLSEVAMISNPNAKTADLALDFDSWTVESKHHRARINDMSINFKQDMVAIAGEDALVRIWNLNTELTEQKLNESQVKHTLGFVLPCRLPVDRVCWSPTGNVIAAATRDPIHDAGCVLIWRITNGKAELIHRLEIQASELAFCPLGSRIAIQSQEAVSVFDLSAADSKEIFSIAAAEITRCAWSPDGKMLVCTRPGTGKVKRQVCLIDVEKATLTSGEKAVVRLYRNCNHAGYTKFKSGLSILSIVQEQSAKSQIYLYLSNSLLPIENVAISSNSKIVYRENQNHFFRVDRHLGLNYPKVKDIFRVSIDRRAEFSTALQFEKLVNPNSQSGINVELQDHFVVDRRLNLVEARQFIGNSGSKWFNNLIPTEHDPANGFAFQLHALDNTISGNSGQISVRNIRNGEFFSGPKIDDASRQTMLFQKGAIASSPDGTRIAFLGKDVVRIHNLQRNSSTEVQIDEITSSPPRLYWTSDSRFLIVQHLSNSGLTIISPNSNDSEMTIKAEANAKGMEFSDSSDRIILDREQPNRVFWRHRSDGIGFFDIETGQKLVEYVIQPRADETKKNKSPWIASYDWHQATGSICLLIKDSLLESKSRLEIHKLSGLTLKLVKTIELDSQLASDIKPEFATFDENADHLVLISKLPDDDSHNDQETSYRAHKINLRTNAITNVGTMLNSQREFLTNRQVVLALSSNKTSVLSIDDSKIRSVPFAKDSVQQSRSLCKFGDRFVLICGRQITLFDEDFRLLSTYLNTNPGQNEGVSITRNGDVKNVEGKNREPVELITVGVKGSELVIEPFAKGNQ